MALVLLQDVFLELLDQRGALGFRRDAGQKRHHIVGLLVDAVVPGRLVEKRRMHRWPRRCKESLAALGLVFFAKDGRHIFENLQLLDAVAVVEKLGGGAARPVLGIHAALWRNPVTDKIPGSPVGAHDAVFRAGLEIVHEPADRVVVFLQHALVAVVEIMPPSDRGEEARPPGAATAHGKRRHMRHVAIGTLPDPPIHEPFPVESVGPEARHEALRRDLPVAVAQTLAVRAIDIVAPEIQAALSPLVHARDAVKELVRALEGADWLQVALNEHGHGILFFWRHGQALHQNIAEARVVEFVFENLARLAGGDELTDLVEVLVAAVRQGLRFPTEPDFHSVVLLVGKCHSHHRAFRLG